MIAMTFKQPYASLIITGCAQYLFRTGKPAKVAWDQTIGVHAARAYAYETELLHYLDTMERYGPDACGIRRAKQALAERMIKRFMEDRTNLPSSALLGTVKLRMPIRPKEITEGNAGLVSSKIWAWPFSSPRKLKEPIQIVGHCGVWEYDAKAA